MNALEPIQDKINMVDKEIVLFNSKLKYREKENEN